MHLTPRTIKFNRKDEKRVTTLLARLDTDEYEITQTATTIESARRDGADMQMQVRMTDDAAFSLKMGMMGLIIEKQVTEAERLEREALINKQIVTVKVFTGTGNEVAQ